MNSLTPARVPPNALKVADTSLMVGQGTAMPVFRQYIQIAYRWRLVILGSIAVCFLIGLIITLLMTPQYTATATLEISRESNKIVDIQGVERDASIADQEFYQTQYGLLRSNALAVRVAQQLGLPENKQFFDSFGVKQSSDAFKRVNNVYPAAGHKARERAAAEALLKRIVIAPTRLSRLVDVRFTAPDAQLASRITNAWTANFIRSTLERRYQATSYARKFLESRLDQLRNKLEQSERQLVAYATSQQIINLPVSGGQANDGKVAERSVVADDLVAMNLARASATADRIQAEARYRQAGGNASAESLRNDAITGLRQKRAELAADYERLLTQFQPQYPAAAALQSQIKQLDRSIAQEEARVSRSIADAYREAVSREAGLNSQVASLKGNLLDLRRRSIQYNIFQREVDTSRQLYEGLLQRYKEIGVTGGVGVNNVSIVDDADVPEKPSSPRLLINLFASIVAGILVGILLAFILEQVEDAIADPAQVEQLIGLPLLGTVPKLEGVLPSEAALDRKSDLVDAYLAVMTNLQFATEHGTPRTLAVTSSRPAEGKTTTALLLATVLARAGRKVLLIDGDMRSPTLHLLVHTTGKVGLSNYLAGSDAIESLLIRETGFGFVGMAAGPLPPNAAELLTGDRLSQLLTEVLREFDHVVIDCPPVMGLADAPLIGGKVEAVVYAIEAHGVRASMVRAALSRLHSANVRIAGGVLTKFEARKAHYGYGYEYGYGYGYGVDAAAEAKVKAHSRLT